MLVDQRIPLEILLFLNDSIIAIYWSSPAPFRTILLLIKYSVTISQFQFSSVVVCLATIITGASELYLLGIFHSGKVRMKI